MRIISGRFKGRNLVSFKADHIRPTTDRVKETLFNILMHDVAEQRVLDLFAGTGNLGLEALSRGAKDVTFVEAHRDSIKIIRENIRLLKVEKECEIIAKDVFRFLKDDRGGPYHLIFCDPPFTEKIAHPTMGALANSPCVEYGSIAVIESSRHERIDDVYESDRKGAFQLLDRRQFGDKSASFFVFKPKEPPK